MTLGALTTTTTVRLLPDGQADQLTINGAAAEPAALARVSKHLDLLRGLSGARQPAAVDSENNFPAAAGIASSASAFAALTLAACAAYRLGVDPSRLSSIARRGSGSAARSIFGGFVHWHAADEDEASFAEPFAPASHWPLHDWVAVVTESEKAVGSTAGHAAADSSPFQAARLASVVDSVARCRQAILERDFERLALIAELDSDMMHAVMMTSSPPLMYWKPATLAVMAAVRQMRENGVPVFYTVDAGPNPHCICPGDAADEVRQALESVPGVLRLIGSGVGGPVELTHSPE